MFQIPSTLKEKRRFWLSHLETWRDSGRSMAAYARQAGISSKSLGYWHSKGRQASSPTATPQRPRPVPVSVAATTAPEPSASSSRFHWLTMDGCTSKRAAPISDVVWSPLRASRATLALKSLLYC